MPPRRRCCWSCCCAASTSTIVRCCPGSRGPCRGCCSSRACRHGACCRLLRDEESMATVSCCCCSCIVCCGPAWPCCGAIPGSRVCRHCCCCCCLVLLQQLRARQGFAGQVVVAVAGSCVCKVCLGALPATEPPSSSNVGSSEWQHRPWLWCVASRHTRCATAAATILQQYYPARPSYTCEPPTCQRSAAPSP